MKLYPNCKINLGLRVVRKRADGYHDLETIFVPIYGLHDELEVVVKRTDSSAGRIQRTDSSADSIQRTDRLADRIQGTGSISFEQEGIAVDCAEEDNLIIKCYRMMADKYPKIGPVRIRFKKNIPFGAGLGGGSSDAAHMALALNELFDLGLSKEQLAQDVRALGADCPFFIYNTPCYAEGIGDLLTPIDLDLKGVRIVLIKPDEGVSTKEAYSGILVHPEISGKIKSVFCQTKPSYAKFSESDKASVLLVNDFEESVFPNHPVIADIKKRLLEAGAFYASMSGSGSTVFGLFKDDAEGRTNTQLALLKEEFSTMVLLDDTFGEWKS